MTEQDPYNAALDQHLRDAISTLSHGRQAVTRWAVVYEVTDGDIRLPDIVTSDGMAPQDTLGLLDWARLATEHHARLIIAAMNED